MDLCLLHHLLDKLPELKGKRELLWRKHKSADTNKKAKVLKEINVLTEEIDKIQSQKNACNRIIARYKEIKINFQKDIEFRQKTQEFIITNKHTKMKNRC